MSQCLKVASRWGNIDVRAGVPKGYEHVRGKRLQVICRKLKIRFAQALIGWGGTKRYPKPIHDGVVVSARSASRLRLALQVREARAKARPPVTEEMKTERRRRREEKDAEILKTAILDLFRKHRESDRTRARSHLLRQTILDCHYDGPQKLDH